MSIRFRWLFVLATFCGLSFVGCTGFVYVLCYQGPVNGDGHHAYFRWSFGDFLCRAFEFYVGDEDYFVGGRGQ